MPKDDERCGKVSASGIERVTLCPGSHALEKLNLRPELPSAYAQIGTLIHEHMAHWFIKDRKTKPSSLIFTSIQQLDTIERLKAQLEVVLMAASAYLGGSARQGEVIDREHCLFLSERRLWDLDHEFSGKPDILIVHKTANFAIIADYKTGWGDVEPAADNLQLRALATLVFDIWGIERVVVAVIQPAVQSLPSIAFYGFYELVNARQQIKAVLKAAEDPNAPRHPSATACRYCTAKLDCPEAMNVFDKVSIGELATDWPSLLDQCEVAQLVIDELRARAKEQLAAQPESVPGWKLEPGSTRVHVTDAKEAFAQISDVVTSERFLRCCTVKIGELSVAYATAANMKKKSGRESLLARLGALAEERITAPSLKKLTKSEIEKSKADSTNADDVTPF